MRAGRGPGVQFSPTDALLPALTGTRSGTSALIRKYHFSGPSPQSGRRNRPLNTAAVGIMQSVWWCTSVIPVPGRLRLNIVNSGPGWAMERISGYAGLHGGCCPRRAGAGPLPHTVLWRAALHQRTGHIRFSPVWGSSDARPPVPGLPASAVCGFFCPLQKSPPSTTRVPKLETFPHKAWQDLVGEAGRTAWGRSRAVGTHCPQHWEQTRGPGATPGSSRCEGHTQQQKSPPGASGFGNGVGRGQSVWACGQAAS